MGRRLLVGIAIIIALAGAPVGASAQDTQSPTQLRMEQDHTFRNRYYIGWSFFVFLLVFGIYSATRSNPKGPRPRNG